MTSQAHSVTLVLIARIPPEGIEAFRAYEDAVLPLLPAFNGRVERRLRNPDGTIEVHIVHSYRGDLVVTLLAPDGSTYALKSSSTSDSAANVDATYTRNLSSETAAGTWRLQVQDVYAEDSGYIDSWTLTV